MCGFVIYSIPCEYLGPSLKLSIDLNSESEPYITVVGLGYANVYPSIFLVFNDCVNPL